MKMPRRGAVLQRNRCRRLTDELELVPTVSARVVLADGRGGVICSRGSAGLEATEQQRYAGS